MKKVVSCVLGLSLILNPVFSFSGDKESRIVELVDKVIAFYKENGRERTIKLLQTLDGPFRENELYVYAIDFRGVMLADSANPSLVGKNLTQLKDAKGEAIWPPLIEIARNEGSGWSLNWWLRYGEKNPTLKLNYVKRVPGEEVIICSGYYVE